MKAKTLAVFINPLTGTYWAVMGKKAFSQLGLQIALGYPCKKLCSEISQEGN